MSLYRRRNSSYFWCRFTIRGREVRQSTGTAERAKAEEYETHLRSRYWRQVKLGESSHTFGEAADRWLLESDTDSKAKDAQILMWLCDQEDDAGLRNIELRDITPDVIATVRGKLSEGNLSRTTVNHYMGALRKVLRKAHLELRWVESIPKVPMYRRDLTDPRFATRAQFRTLAKKLPRHLADMARFAVATGLRAGNITGLTWGRVDLRRRTAYVPGSEAKAGKGIPLPLNADAIAVLKRWKGKHDTHVFHYQDHPIRYVTTKAWHRAAKAAGLEGFTFHDLRHTWASWQVQSGTPLSVLRELGGWADFQMVLRYAHLDPGHLKKYAGRTLLGTPRRRAAAKHR